MTNALVSFPFKFRRFVPGVGAGVGAAAGGISLYLLLSLPRQAEMATRAWRPSPPAGLWLVFALLLLAAWVRRRAS